MPGPQVVPGNIGACPVQPAPRPLARSSGPQNVLDRVLRAGAGTGLRFMSRRSCRLLRSGYAPRLLCCMVRQWPLGADSSLTAQREGRRRAYILGPFQLEESGSEQELG